MQWIDEGIVLGYKRHGEANAILEVMTCAHGRHLGLVRGGTSSRLRPVLQPGNRISCTWRARLDEHLGHYMVEALDARAAAFLAVPHALYGMTHLAALCRLLAERDPHPQIHAALTRMLDDLLDAHRAAPHSVTADVVMERTSGPLITGRARGPLHLCPAGKAKTVAQMSLFRSGWTEILSALRHLNDTFTALSLLIA